MTHYPQPEWIKEQLAVSGRTQRELAAALNVDASAVSRMLRGQRRLKLTEIPTFIALISPGRLPRAVSSDYSGDRPTRHRLERIMMAAGIHVSELAALSGVDEAELQRCMAGHRDTIPGLIRIAKILGVREGYLTGELTDTGWQARIRERWKPILPDKYPDTAQEHFSAARLPTLPIYVAPRRQENGYLALSKTVAERKVCPPEFSGVQGGWGMYIGDDDLAPRLFAGEIVFVHPHRPVLLGDHVVAFVDTDHIAIGRLVTRTAENIRLEYGYERHILTLAPSSKLEAIAIIHCR